jgi:ribosomal protein S18 acetylase RimI-like enzyme
MLMECIIRSAEIKDISSIQEVARETWNYTYKEIIPEEIENNFLDYAYSSECMKNRIEQSVLLVAEKDEKIFGFANFSPIDDDNNSKLMAIYIKPDLHGKGIGTKLLQAGLDKLKGVAKISVNVEKENQIGKNYYHAKGFSLVEEFEEDFDGYTLQTMRMVLKI